MEVDDPTTANQDLEEEDKDSDIELLTCFRGSPHFLPHPAAGRYMTTEISACLDDISLPEVLLAVPSRTTHNHQVSCLISS